MLDIAIEIVSSALPARRVAYLPTRGGPTELVPPLFERSAPPRIPVGIPCIISTGMRSYVPNPNELVTMPLRAKN